MDEKRMMDILYKAVRAYENVLDNFYFDSEEKFHNELLRNFDITHEEYRSIMNYAH